MVKVLYEERNLRIHGESSSPPIGECSPRGGGHGHGNKAPSTPPSSSQPYSPSSSSSSTTTTLQPIHTHASKETSKSPLLKIDVRATNV